MHVRKPPTLTLYSISTASATQPTAGRVKPPVPVEPARSGPILSPAATRQGRSRPTRSEHADGCPSIGPAAARPTAGHRGDAPGRPRRRAGVPDLACRDAIRLLTVLHRAAPPALPAHSDVRFSQWSSTSDWCRLPRWLMDPWLISFLSVFAGRPGYEDSDRCLVSRPFAGTLPQSAAAVAL